MYNEQYNNNHILIYLYHNELVEKKIEVNMRNTAFLILHKLLNFYNINYVFNTMNELETNRLFSKYNYRYGWNTFFNLF